MHVLLYVLTSSSSASPSLLSHLLITCHPSTSSLPTPSIYLLKFHYHFVVLERRILKAYTLYLVIIWSELLVYIFYSDLCFIIQVHRASHVVPVVRREEPGGARSIEVQSQTQLKWQHTHIHSGEMAAGVTETQIPVYIMLCLISVVIVKLIYKNVGHTISNPNLRVNKYLVMLP